MDNANNKLVAIQKAISAIRKTMATKDDIKNMATKDDIKNLELKIVEKIDEAQMEIIATVDKHKADKESIKVLEKRIDRLEENADLPPYLD